MGRIKDLERIGLRDERGPALSIGGHVLGAAAVDALHGVPKHAQNRPGAVQRHGKRMLILTTILMLVA